MKSNLDYFCIVGAQRSGTTYLYNILDECPQIEMSKPVRPEPKFFLNDIEFRKGLNFYLEKYFKDVKDTTKLIGEKGTSYFEYSYVANRIHSFFKNAKIFIILRNPVTRALSNYFFSVENGLETRTLHEVFVKKTKAPVSKITTSTSPFTYLERGHYLEFMKPYFNIFGDNVRVIVFEELIGNIDLIQSIYQFLDINSEFVPPSINKKINESKYMDGGDIAEVSNILYSYYMPHVKLLEGFMKRKIELWYD